MASFAEKLINNIITPGTAPQLVPIINVALICLLVMLGITAYTGYASIHLAVLGFLAIGLMISLNWFIAEYNKALVRNAENPDQVSDSKSKSD
mmetsp:Transcript_25955/g.33565  ORF Transcript_25955/g.33565 Transcript_25955/m.33565 type:complete len:93 (+) Transcript_25955:80-358(+)